MNSALNKTKCKEISLNERKSTFKPVYGCYTKEEAISEASRCLSCPKPKCVEGCPIHNCIPEILKATRDEDFKLAYSLIRENSCLPEICSVVCPHEKQCSGHCVRSNTQEGVNIGDVERFISEFAIEKKLDVIKAKPNGKKIAAIGSGPASLSFALTMAEKGYQVTIYEKENYIGGILSYGIPSYRLDNQILEHLIAKLKASNVLFVLNTEVGKDFTLDNLISNFDGVFIGTGATKQNSLQIVDKNAKNVYFAGDFLEKVNHAPMDKDGKRLFKECGKNVVVVGGGNAAMDAARDAIRLPQVESVKIVYRRTEKEMPACASELNDAKVEGVEFLTLTNPSKFIYKNDKLEALECAVMELGEPDESNRRKPIESNKPHIFINTDTVILALGSSNNKEFSNGTNLKVDDWGAILVDENNKTSIDMVYAGGDVVSGPSTVVNAMKHGMNAANNMHKELRK